MRNLVLPLLFILIAFGCGTQGVSLETEGLLLTVEKGFVASLEDGSGRDFIPEGHLQPLLQLRVNGKYLVPKSMKVQPEGLLLNYGDRTASIKVESKANYIRLEVTDLEPSEDVELAVWGPFHTEIDSIIGETVGVVRGGGYALGLQSLNVKTLGGYPWNENDAMPQVDIFESGNYSDLSEEGKRYVLYRVEAAKPEEFGSSLQAYTRNRKEARVVENLGREKYIAPPLDDGGIVGSAIALFGGPVDDALDLIESVELGEGLPHPTIDGVWTKRSPLASSAYLILDYTEENIEKCLDYTQKAGLRYLYHGGPFETWGHFKLNPESFPHGREGLRSIVDKAASRGISIGAHTLSNFITTNDPYVSPVPDPRLAVVGGSALATDISSTDVEIYVDDDQFFLQGNNSLRTVRIGNELVRYGEVTGTGPYILKDCQRGAFGTESAFHQKGKRIELLADHAYKVFLSNTELTIDISRNLAALYNETGLRQISFDGLEGNRSTGTGSYGETLMPVTWFNGLNDEIRDHYIADASRTTHFFWHVFTRMNWGEPWYAGFRESQTEYRMKNQAYFQRNMIPGMLGWFLLRSHTSLEDMEWLLAKSAAFNAGYAFVCNFNSLESNGQTDVILELIKNYEQLRIQGKFSPEQRKLMMDTGMEFHLEFRDEDNWELYRFHIQRAIHSGAERQPGEPTGTEVAFSNPFDEQVLGFLISTPESSGVMNLKLEVDRYRSVDIAAHIPASSHLKYTGGDQAVLYDQDWNFLGELPIDPANFTLGKGEHQLIFDGSFRDTEAGLKLELKVKERI